MDLVKAAYFLKKHRPSTYEKVKSLIGILNIE
jgi:hypothetical protein